MGAKHVVNHYQMTMFERAKDLLDTKKYVHTDLSDYEDINDLKAQKLGAAKYDYDESGQDTGDPNATDEPFYEHTDESLYDSIARRGVQKPVQLSFRASSYDGSKEDPEGRRFIRDGHHRAVVSNDVDPERWVPVTWSD